MKPNPISALLKRYGNAKEIAFQIDVTDQNGQKTTDKGSVTSKGEAAINNVIAVKLLMQAITGKGDLKAIDMIMDRTEGKPLQKIEDTTPATGEIVIKIEGGNPPILSEDDLPEYKD